MMMMMMMMMMICCINVRSKAGSLNQLSLPHDPKITRKKNN